VKLEQIDITTVAQSLAGVLLVGAIALFGYDASKPGIVLASPSQVTVKASPMNPELSVKEQLHRLPPLPERYQRKVLVYGWRSGKNFPKSAPSGKVYMVASSRTQADDE
jgi:hypothetical protein